MGDTIIWLHEDALRITHPVVSAAPLGTPIIHVWDDAFLKAAGYSLKRLVFLYETLCVLPLEIRCGNTIETLRNLDATNLYVPSSPNPSLQESIRVLSLEKNVQVIAEEPFVNLSHAKDYTRFFPYWGKAEKTVFLIDGGAGAQRS